MIVQISSDAEVDLLAGFRFYEDQSKGLGNYFRDCTLADIDLLTSFGGIHEKSLGHHRMLCKRFPYAIYYHVDKNVVIVVAILDCRRSPSWIRQRLS